jgi:hypothetical protein
MVTKAELADTIARAGFQVAGMETGQASSIGDALHTQWAESEGQAKAKIDGGAQSPK